jgi:hypothetical protein
MNSIKALKKYYAQFTNIENNIWIKMKL